MGNSVMPNSLRISSARIRLSSDWSFAGKGFALIKDTHNLKSNKNHYQITIQIICVSIDFANSTSLSFGEVAELIYSLVAVTITSTEVS